MKVENQVELAHITKVAVEYFYEVVYDIEHNQLIVWSINATGKVKRRVPFENYFIFAPLQEVR